MAISLLAGSLPPRNWQSSGFRPSPDDRVAGHWSSRLRSDGPGFSFDELNLKLVPHRFGRPHDIGEKPLKCYLAKSDNDEQRKWLNDRLMSVYNNALKRTSPSRSGIGRTKLFDAIVALARQELDRRVVSIPMSQARRGARGSNTESFFLAP
jgi:hypothetical protein